MPCRAGSQLLNVSGEKVMSKEFDRMKFGQMVADRDYDVAIAYADRFRRKDPESEELRQFAARARTSKVEIMAMEAARIGETPSPQRLDEMIRLLNLAVELEPDLADAHWNLAVIHARYRKDAKRATLCLRKAKDLGYRHPMMRALEALLDDLD